MEILLLIGFVVELRHNKEREEGGKKKRPANIIVAHVLRLLFLVKNYTRL